jgi:hypothetical protein
MNKIYKLNNGWIVEKKTDGVPVLHVTPILNTVFKKKHDVEITDEIFDDISQGERDISNLFKKYKLHKLIMKYGAVEVNPSIVFTNTSNRYYGRGFIAKHEGDKYFLEYQLSTQGGGERRFEISKEIYEDARIGDKSTSDLFKKYNLYHLDIPENDVK